MDQSTPLSFFETIPPERLGLHGEYDYHGLAKRVQFALEQHFDPQDIADLKVSQRGAVVVLVGKLPNQRGLNHLIAVAMSVNGAVGVEVNGKSIFSLRNYPMLDSDPLLLSSFAC